MATYYGQSTYATVIADINDEMNEDSRLSGLSPESIIKWILQACQRISETAAIREYLILRLVQGQEEYEFADTDTPVTGSGTVSTTANSNALTGTTAAGTGTISSDGSTITGVGTAFVSELSVGVAIVDSVYSDVLTVLEIHSDTEIVVSGPFTADLPAGTTFTYSNTKFTRELVVGSTVTVNTVERVILAITNPYTATTTAPFTATNATLAFTIDRKVTEIPTKFDTFVDTTREESSYHPQIKFWSIQQLRDLQNRDTVQGFYTNLDRPFCMAPWVNQSGRRVLTVYPTSDSDKQTTLYGMLRIRPEAYTASVETTSRIPLDARYEPAIREYVKMRMWGWLSRGSASTVGRGGQIMNAEAVREREAKVEFERLKVQVAASDYTPMFINVDPD